MDLGIKGRNALVCAASKGLSRACAMSLAREGANVTIVVAAGHPHEHGFTRQVHLCTGTDGHRAIAAPAVVDQRQARLDTPCARRHPNRDRVGRGTGRGDIE